MHPIKVMAVSFFSAMDMRMTSTAANGAAAVLRLVITYRNLEEGEQFSGNLTV
jgi:hypothetical protein